MAGVLFIVNFYEKNICYSLCENTIVTTADFAIVINVFVDFTLKVSLDLFYREQF